MACFLVPTAEAIVTTVIAKTAKDEKDYTDVNIDTGIEVSEKPVKMSFVRKLRWLSNMLWGGAVLLCFEHLLFRFRVIQPDVQLGLHHPDLSVSGGVRPVLFHELGFPLEILRSLLQQQIIIEHSVFFLS